MRPWDGSPQQHKPDASLGWMGQPVTAYDIRVKETSLGRGYRPGREFLSLGLSFPRCTGQGRTRRSLIP